MRGSSMSAERQELSPPQDVLARVLADAMVEDIREGKAAAGRRAGQRSTAIFPPAGRKPKWNYRSKVARCDDEKAATTGASETRNRLVCVEPVRERNRSN
jgi:hypothetical protein